MWPVVTLLFESVWIHAVSDIGDGREGRVTRLVLFVSSVKILSFMDKLT